MPQLPTVQRAEVTLSKVDDELLTLRIAGTVATDPALATPETIRVDGAIEGIQRLGRDGVLRASMLRAEAALRLPAMEQVPASMKLESSLRRASRQDLARLRSRVKSSLDRAEQELTLVLEPAHPPDPTVPSELLEREIRFSEDSAELHETALLDALGLGFDS